MKTITKYFTSLIDWEPQTLTPKTSFVKKYLTSLVDWTPIYEPIRSIKPKKSLSKYLISKVDWEPQNPVVNKSVNFKKYFTSLVDWEPMKKSEIVYYSEKIHTIDGSPVDNSQSKISIYPISPSKMNNKVCLLITVFNRSALLKNSLERMTYLTRPDSILIVDDGSTDDCEAVVKSFANRLPIRYIYNHNPDWSICSFARNVGVKNTDCDIVITSEPEIIFCKDTIPRLLNRAKQYPNQIITAGQIYHMGPAATLHPNLITNPNEQLLHEVVNISTNDPNPIDPHGYALIKNWQATYVALYEKKWIMDVGGFDEDFPQPYSFDDIDLCTRIRIKCGVGQYIDPDIPVIHQWHTRPDFAGQATQINSKYFENKNLSVNGVEDRNNPNLIANQGHEWGVIKPKP